MKNIFTLLTVCLITVGAFAQKPYKIATSSEITLQNKSFADNIISYGTDGVCMVSSKNSGMRGWKSPDVINTKFNLYKNTTFQKSVSLKPLVEGAKYIASYSNNEKLCFADASYNKLSKEIELYYHETNNDGSIKKSTLMNNAKGGTVWLNAPEYLFKTFQSPDNKKTASIAIYKDDDKKSEYVLCYYGFSPALLKTNSMNVSVIDENGDLSFKKSIVINAPAECNKISIEDFKVNNDGDIFLMVKQYIKGKKEKKGDDVNYKLYIYAITNNGSSSKKYPIDTKGYFCKSPELVVSNTGNVFCAGLLSEKVSGKFVGIFTQKLGSDLDAAQYKVNKITSEDILKYNSKYKFKEDEISEKYIINHIVETSNSVHIFAEYYNEVTRTSSNGNTTTTYYFQDILYFEFDHTLNLKQIYVIPKYQRAYSPAFLGYQLIFHKEKPYFIFNDNKQNTDKNADEKIVGTGATFKSYAAMMVYHNGTSWVRERLFEKEEVEDNILMTSSVRQFDENNVFLPFQRKGSYILGRLTFTD